MPTPRSLTTYTRTMLSRFIHSSTNAQISANLITQSQTVAVSIWRNQSIWSTKLYRIAKETNSHLDILSTLFAKQCHAIAAQRICRILQITNLYSRLYDRKSLVHMLARLGNSILKCTRNRQMGLLFGASIFSWDTCRITDEEMQRVADDISSASLKNLSKQNVQVNDWQKVIDRPQLQVWRKPIEDSHLYQYKVHGSFYDIPACAFFLTQVDLSYRKTWDKFVIKLDVVDQDEKSGTEVVHWITHFPYPMYSREYVYARRFKVDEDNKLMLLSSSSIDHPCCPLNSSYVRVTNYTSKMVIKPHTNFYENGFDYVLTYSDDPQAAFPMFAYNWMASTGVPDFVEKLHQAAKNLHKSNNSNKSLSFIQGVHSSESNQYSRISSYY